MPYAEGHCYVQMLGQKMRAGLYGYDILVIQTVKAAVLSANRLGLMGNGKGSTY